MEKCGEVLLSNNTKFIFVCTFCDRHFKEMLSFGKHITQDHITKTPEINESSSFVSKLEDKLNIKSESSLIKKEYDNVADRKLEENHPENLLTETPCNDAEDGNNDDNLVDQVFESPKTNISKEENKTKIIQQKDEGKQFIDPANVEDTSKLINDIVVVVKPSHRVPYLQCEFCDQKFENKSKRTRHQRTHTGEKPFPCPHCEKRFASKSNVKEHIFIHTGERPYKCTHCPTTFKHKMNLKVHIRTHLGEKRFKCDYCDKRFVRNIERKIHIRTHTGEKPFQCEECGASFTVSSALTAHKKRHTNTRNYKCEICAKAFYSKFLLTNHLVVHSDARPFQCDICLSTFSMKIGLLAHVKIHSDIKEYICRICGKGFAQNSGRHSHMKTHGVNLGQRKNDTEKVVNA